MSKSTCSGTGTSLEELISKIICLLFFLSGAVHAETVDNSKFSDTNPYGGVGTSVTHVGGLPVLEIEGAIDRSFQNKIKYCSFNTFGGHFSISNGVGESLASMSVFGVSFPLELVDINQNLKEGFSNKVTITSYGVTTEYTAKYQSGKLSVTARSKMGSTVMNNSVDIFTRTNVLGANMVVQKLGAEGPYASKITCGETPTT